LSPQELIQQIAMACMNFNARRSEFLRRQRATDERVTNRFQISGRGSSSVRLARVNQTRRAQRGKSGIRAITAFLPDRAFMPQLQKHAAPGPIYRVEALLPGNHGLVVDAAEHRRLRGRGMINSARFGNDQPHAARDPLAVVLGKPRLRHTFIAPLALHSRHHEAIRQYEAVD
jgi:hypothetical protein